MKKIIFLILLIIIYFKSYIAEAVQYEWIQATPTMTDNTNYEWCMGSPYVVHENVAEEPAAAPSGAVPQILILE